MNQAALSPVSSKLLQPPEVSPGYRRLSGDLDIPKLDIHRIAMFPHELHEFPPINRGPEVRTNGSIPRRIRIRRSEDIAYCTASARTVAGCSTASLKPQDLKLRTYDIVNVNNNSTRPGFWKRFLMCLLTDTDERKIYPSSLSSTTTVSTEDRSCNKTQSDFKDFCSSDDPTGNIAVKTTVPKFRSLPGQPTATKILLPPKLDTKPCLVLDLDETLIHSTFEDPGQFDFIVRMNVQGKRVGIYVIKRPFLDEFLESMSNLFEIGVFTASLEEYANKVIQQIDPNGHIQWALYRDSCSLYDGSTVKNLEFLPRQLDRTVIIDDRPMSYMFQPSNGIECVPFEGNMEDTELRSLQETLYRLSQIDGDLRNAIKKKKQRSSEFDSSDTGSDS